MSIPGKTWSQFQDPSWKHREVECPFCGKMMSREGEDKWINDPEIFDMQFGERYDWNESAELAICKSCAKDMHRIGIEEVVSQILENKDSTSAEPGT